eukprot:1227866-Rhodomonas_salina.1
MGRARGQAEAIRAGEEGSELTVAEKRHQLGVALAKAGRLREALPLLELSMQARAALLGRNHPMVADVLNDKGLVHLELGDVRRALSLLRQSLKMKQRAGVEKVSQ